MILPTCHGSPFRGTMKIGLTLYHTRFIGVNKRGGRVIDRQKYIDAARNNSGRCATWVSAWQRPWFRGSLHFVNINETKSGYTRWATFAEAQFRPPVRVTEAVTRQPFVIDDRAVWYPRQLKFRGRPITLSRVCFPGTKRNKRHED